jgi:hypothetical protein
MAAAHGVGDGIMKNAHAAPLSSGFLRRAFPADLDNKLHPRRAVARYVAQKETGAGMAAAKQEIGDLMNQKLDAPAFLRGKAQGSAEPGNGNLRFRDVKNMPEAQDHGFSLP